MNPSNTVTCNHASILWLHVVPPPPRPRSVPLRVGVPDVVRAGRVLDAAARREAREAKARSLGALGPGVQALCMVMERMFPPEVSCGVV
jgi:hypothetical protein